MIGYVVCLSALGCSTVDRATSCVFDDFLASLLLLLGHLAAVGVASYLLSCSFDLQRLGSQQSLFYLPSVDICCLQSFVRKPHKRKDTTFYDDVNDAPRQTDKDSTSWRSDVPPSCLRVGPGQHPRYIRADLGQEAVGGSTTTTRTRR